MRVQFLLAITGIVQLDEPCASSNPEDQGNGGILLQGAQAIVFRSSGGCVAALGRSEKKVDPAAERPFKLISAPESLHSMVIAIRRDCDEEIKDNLIAWRRILLSTSVIFKVIENSDEMYWEHLSLREKPGLEYDLVRHSALQRICDIQQRALHVPSYHRTSNRALAKMLFKDYQRLQVSERSEKITETFIFHCLEAVGSVNT